MGKLNGINIEKIFGDFQIGSKDRKKVKIGLKQAVDIVETTGGTTATNIVNELSVEFPPEEVDAVMRVLSALPFIMHEGQNYCIKPEPGQITAKAEEVADDNTNTHPSNTQNLNLPASDDDTPHL